MASEREIALRQIAEIDAKAAKKPGRRAKTPQKPGTGDAKKNAKSPAQAAPPDDSHFTTLLMPAKQHTTANQGFVPAEQRTKKGHKGKGMAHKDPKPSKLAKVDHFEVMRLSDTISVWTVARLV